MNEKNMEVFHALLQEYVKEPEFWDFFEELGKLVKLHEEYPELKWSIVKGKPIGFKYEDTIIEEFPKLGIVQDVLEDEDDEGDPSFNTDSKYVELIKYIKNSN